MKINILENGEVITRDMTAEEELAELEKANTPGAQIEALKQQLSATDYKAIKYAEGLISAEEYADTKAQRQAWRDEINRLEEEERHE